jgi:cytochrome oxidase Cu insertion factor (SCO1/SenC/PrrC family)
MNLSSARQRSGRRQLLLVASIFFVPLAAAVALYFSASWRPPVGVQHGELIDPPRPLPEIAFTRPDGGTTAADVLRGRWFLVIPIEGACNERCLATLADLRQLRLALDKDAPRVQRVLLHDGRCCEAGSPAMAPDLLVLGAAGPEGDALRALFPPATDGDNGIYIVDPHGNLMMSYPATGAARGLLKDLERLLRLSSIG